MHKFCFTAGISVQDFEDAKFSTFTGITKEKVHRNCSAYHSALNWLGINT